MAKLRHRPRSLWHARDDVVPLAHRSGELRDVVAGHPKRLVLRQCPLLQLL